MNMTEGNTPRPASFDDWYQSIGQHMKPVESSTLRIAFWHVWQAATEAAQQGAKGDVLAGIHAELARANRLKHLEMQTQGQADSIWLSEAWSGERKEGSS